MHTIDQIILAHVTKKSGLMKEGLYCTWHTPYPSVLDFWKIQFEKTGFLTCKNQCRNWFLQPTQANVISYLQEWSNNPHGWRKKDGLKRNSTWLGLMSFPIFQICLQAFFSSLQNFLFLITFNTLLLLFFLPRRRSSVKFYCSQEAKDQCTKSLVKNFEKAPHCYFARLNLKKMGSF